MLPFYRAAGIKKKKRNERKKRRYSPNADRMQRVKQIVIKNHGRKGTERIKKFHSKERGFLEDFLGTQLRKQQHGTKRYENEITLYEEISVRLRTFNKPYRILSVTEETVFYRTNVLNLFLSGEYP